MRTLPPAAALPLLLLVPPAFAAPANAAPDPREIVVTATPLRGSPLETAQPAIVLAGDELERSIAKSLGETLSEQLGITGTYFGPVASRPVIRGLSNQRVQVLEDSIASLDISSLSEDHSVTVDPLVARSIEVVKGPGTLLYGNAAVGGVVNVLTNRIPEARQQDPFQGAVELRGDTVSDQRSGALRLDGQVGDFALHADGFRRDSNNIDIPGNSLSDRLVAELEANGDEIPTNSNGEVYGSDGETDGWSVGGSWLVGDRGFLGASATGYDANYGTPGPESQPDGSSVRIDMEQRRYDLSGGLKNPLPGLTAVRLRAGKSDYTHTEFEPDGAPGTRFDQDATEFRLAFDHGPLASWRGTFGAQYGDVDFKAEGEEAFIPPSKTKNLGLFVFEERPIGKVNLQVGVRYEDQSIDPESGLGLAAYDDESWNGSAGAVWEFATEYSAALNYTYAQRHPTATELYANGPHVALARFEVGDDSLGKEATNTVDLALRKYAGDLQFLVSVFYSDYSDFIFPQPTGGFAGDEEPFPVVQYVAEDAEFYGAEAEVSLPLLDDDLNNLRLRLLTDYVRGKLANGGGNVPLMPPWRVGAQLDYTRGGWEAGLEVFRYASQDKVATNELRTDGYTMLGANVGYRLPTTLGPLLLFLQGSNLADEEARRSTSPVKDYAPLPGVSVLAGARLEF
ncbi:MAG: TonB-dependent receptor [Gammaproteobacteria bacterium]|nr:TonB-dependent receptor [Gammaproteobacteria bacterium]